MEQHAEEPVSPVQDGGGAAAASPGPQQGSDVEVAIQVAQRLYGRLRAAVVGRDDVIELILVALFADGHVLLEDYPGSGKTTLAKTLGVSIVDDHDENGIPTFRRVQFTPDLLPSDITGVNIFDTERNTFEFRPGPIFAYTVLADEINRTSPKVQSALLEAMAEKQVTVDNTTYPLDELFFVIATQNPLDLAGTYPLPTAQLDRFLFKIRMRHISRNAELEVLGPYPAPREDKVRELPTVTRGEVLTARRLCREHVTIAPAIKECLVDIARATREDAQVMAGVSTRALMFAMPALQARAMFHRRDYVSGEDVKQLVPYIFAHRIELVPGADDAHEIIRQCAAGPLEALSRRSVSS